MEGTSIRQDAVRRRRDTSRLGCCSSNRCHPICADASQVQAANACNLSMSIDHFQRAEGRETDDSSEATTERKEDSFTWPPEPSAQSMARESHLTSTLDAPADSSSDSDDDQSETSSAPSRPQFKVALVLFTYNLVCLDCCEWVARQLSLLCTGGHSG